MEQKQSKTVDLLDNVFSAMGHICWKTAKSDQGLLWLAMDEERRDILSNFVPRETGMVELLCQ